MGLLKDIINIANDAGGVTVDSLDNIFDDDDGGRFVRTAEPVSYDSIAKQAKKGVMQFPTIASRTLSFENMVMIAKASEKNFAALLQVIFSLNQVTTASSPKEYIEQFHQNTNTTIHGPSDVIGYVFNSMIPDVVQKKIIDMVAEGNLTIDQIFNLDSVNSKYLPKDPKMILATEAQSTKIKKVKGNITINVDANASASGGGRRSGGGGDKGPVGMQLPKDIFTDASMKKANELMPTMMHVRILKESSSGENSTFIDFIVGVKASIHPIDSQDMISHIVSLFQERGKLFNFIRWTTGEISFFKDLLFNIDSIKGEISDTRVGKSSQWWSVLKNIKAKRKLHSFTRRNPVLPNAILIISMEEVEYIKANYGYDLLEDKSGQKIIDGFNILQVVIVDASSEVAYFFADGSERWDLVTFKCLQRESGSAESQFKDILKAVNKF